MTSKAENLKGLYDTLSEMRSNSYVVEQLTKIVEVEEASPETEQLQLETHKELLSYYKAL